MTETTEPGPTEAAPEATAGAPGAAVPAAKKRLTSEQWKEIETHWEMGTMTGRQLSETYGVSGSALSQHFERHKIVRGSKKHLIAKKIEEKVAAAAGEVLATFDSKRIDRIESVRESRFLVAQSNFRQITELVKEMNAGKIPRDIKMLRHIEAALSDNFDLMHRILKMDDVVDERKLPTLVFEDLSEEKIQEIRSRGEDDEGAELDFGDEEDDIVEVGEP